VSGQLDIPKDEMESGLFLNIVVAQSATIFKLLASKDESLLVGGDAAVGMRKCGSSERSAHTPPCPGSWP
jgi:hypothetical protein